MGGAMGMGAPTAAFNPAATPNMHELSMMMAQLSTQWPGAMDPSQLPANMQAFTLEQQFAQIQMMQQQWMLMMQEHMAAQQAQQARMQSMGPRGGMGSARSPGRMDPGVPSFMPGGMRGGPRGVVPSNGAGPTREPSPLLQEHKLSGKRLSSQELMGHIVEFSRDSHGSRLVQFKMETGAPEERRAFVAEALPHILSLARDLFGNYVLQNFFDHCDAEQRDEMAKVP